MVVEAAGVEGALEETDNVAVEPVGEVVVRSEDGHVVGGDAESGDGDETHQRPVADEQCGGDGEKSAGALRHETDEASDEVADCDAGEDSEDAEVGVVEVRVKAEEEVEREDDGAAAQDMEG